MFMRNRYNILFSLFGASLVLVGIETQAQENLNLLQTTYLFPGIRRKSQVVPIHTVRLHPH